MKITHENAISLEYLVCEVYGVDRGAFGGLINADNFEQNPFEAAILALSPYFKKDQSKAIDTFIVEYSTVFDYPKDNPEYTFADYYKRLSDLVKLFK